MKIGQVLTSVFLTAACSVGSGDERPNILIIFADDAGYADFGFQGGGSDGDFAELTPHIDALADGGVHFTNGYVSAAVCTPSRAGLLTGRYQHRFGVETVYGQIPEAGLPASEITMADILRKAGYRTYALGKWHLGEHLPEHLPNHRGFDAAQGPHRNTAWIYRGTLRDK
jgi:arylsulfatase A-like enzyme